MVSSETSGSLDVASIIEKLSSSNEQVIVIIVNGGQKQEKSEPIEEPAEDEWLDMLAEIFTPNGGHMGGGVDQPSLLLE